MLNIGFTNAIVYDDKLIWISDYYGICFELPLHTNELKIIPFKEYDTFVHWRGSGVLASFDSTVIIAINGGKYLLKYDLRTEKSELVQANLEEYKLNVCDCCEVVNGYLVIVPLQSKCIIKLNLDNMRYTVTNLEINNYISRNTIRIDSILYHFDYSGDKYVKYDLITEDMEIVEWDGYKNGIKDIINILHKGNRWYFLTMYGEVFSCDYLNKSVKQLKTTENKSSEYEYFLMCLNGDCLWLMPSLGKDIYHIDVRTNEVKLYDTISFSDGSSCAYFNYVEWNERIYIFPHLSSDIPYIDLKANAIVWNKLDCHDILKENVKMDSFILNENQLSLEDWIELI